MSDQLSDDELAARKKRQHCGSLNYNLRYTPDHHQVAGLLTATVPLIILPPLGNWLDCDPDLHAHCRLAFSMKQIHDVSTCVRGPSVRWSEGVIPDGVQELLICC